jgi:hypothetical protein
MKSFFNVIAIILTLQSFICGLSSVCADHLWCLLPAPVLEEIDPESGVDPEFSSAKILDEIFDLRLQTAFHMPRHFIERHQNLKSSVFLLPLRPIRTSSSGSRSPPNSYV